MERGLGTLKATTVGGKELGACPHLSMQAAEEGPEGGGWVRHRIMAACLFARAGAHPETGLPSNQSCTGLWREGQARRAWGALAAGQVIWWGP